MLKNGLVMTNLGAITRIGSAGARPVISTGINIAAVFQEASTLSIAIWMIYLAEQEAFPIFSVPSSAREVQRARVRAHAHVRANNLRAISRSWRSLWRKPIREPCACSKRTASKSRSISPQGYGQAQRCASQAQVRTDSIFI